MRATLTRLTAILLLAGAAGWPAPTAIFAARQVLEEPDSAYDDLEDGPPSMDDDPIPRAPSAADPRPLSPFTQPAPDIGPGSNGYGGQGAGCSGYGDNCCNYGCCQNSCGCCQSYCDCQPCCPADDPYCRLFPQNGLFRIRGWADAGILGNPKNPPSRYNGPFNAVQVDYGQFNQLYMIVDRPLPTCGSGVGFRIDALYGSDYFLAQSIGFETRKNGAKNWNASEFIGLALPQAYAELGNETLSVKLGHFYSIVGYEGVQSLGNFFYSHAYSYQFAGPFTHWGGLATWQVDCNWQAQYGMTNGWNSLSQTVDHLGYLAGLKYTSDCKDWWSSFAIVTGTEQNNPSGQTAIPNAYANRTRYSFLFSKQIGCNLEYVFHQWLGTQAQGAPGGGTASWYGIDQYLYYRLNPQWRLGGRLEWFKDRNGTRVGLTQPGNPNKAPLPGDYVMYSLGANWTPTSNIVIRPEIRWDTYSGNARPYNDRQSTGQFLLGTDAIVVF